MSAPTALIEAIRAADLGNPPRIAPDGRIVRWRGPEDNGRNCWAVLHVTASGFYHGGYGNWRLGLSQSWSEAKSKQLTREELRQLNREIREAAKRQQDEETERHNRVADEALALWNSAPDARADHPYLLAKNVPAFNLREDRNQLLVPMVDAVNRVVNIQRISLTGEKRFLKGGQVKEAFAVLLGRGNRIAIAEGWATAATIHAATQATILAAMNAGNLVAVAEIARRVQPSASIIIAADHDQVGMEAAAKAARAAGCRWLVPSVEGADFADLGIAPTRALLREKWISNAR